MDIKSRIAALEQKLAADKLRTFHLDRQEDESGVSGTGKVAEGVVFTNGWVAMVWLTSTDSLGYYPSIENVEKIHGHGGKTKIVFHD